jgi:hypothetical protein
VHLGPDVEQHPDVLARGQVTHDERVVPVGEARQRPRGRGQETGADALPDHDRLLEQGGVDAPDARPGRLAHGDEDGGRTHRRKVLAGQQRTLGEAELRRPRDRHHVVDREHGRQRRARDEVLHTVHDVDAGALEDRSEAVALPQRSGHLPVPADDERRARVTQRHRTEHVEPVLGHDRGEHDVVTGVERDHELAGEARDPPGPAQCAGEIRDFNWSTPLRPPGLRPGLRCVSALNWSTPLRPPGLRPGLRCVSALNWSRGHRAPASA